MTIEYMNIEHGVATQSVRQVMIEYMHGVAIQAQCVVCWTDSYWRSEKLTRWLPCWSIWPKLKLPTVPCWPIRPKHFFFEISSEIPKLHNLLDFFGLLRCVAHPTRVVAGNSYFECRKIIGFCLVVFVLGDVPWTYLAIDAQPKLFLKTSLIASICEEQWSTILPWVFCTIGESNPIEIGDFSSPKFRFCPRNRRSADNFFEKRS